MENFVLELPILGVFHSLGKYTTFPETSQSVDLLQYTENMECVCDGPAIDQMRELPSLNKNMHE